MGYRRIFLIFICLVALNGCFKQINKEINNEINDESFLAAAIEDIKNPLILMDQRFAIFESALDCVNAYLDNPTGENLEAAKSCCGIAIAKIAQLQQAESCLTQHERTALVRMGLNMADYDVPFQYAGYHKFENIRTLTLLYHYLSNAPSLNDTLAYVLDFNISYQQLDKRLEYIGLNSLFCGVSGEELEHFKNAFLPTLTAFYSDSFTWETDEAVLESKAEYWFSEMESDIDDYAEFTGTRYLQRLEAQAAYRDVLTDAGFSSEEAGSIIKSIDLLQQRAEIE